MSKSAKSFTKSVQPLRIIGGDFKRRQLDFAAIEGLRPTPDRVRETLFNWLMWDINASQVLDVCAGSGALAFEALSRGAKHATLIEPNQHQIQFLKKNIQLLKLTDRTQCYHAFAQPILTQLHQQNQQFDLVFLDPPYQLNLWQELAQCIEPLLHEKSLIYVEANQDLNQLNLPHTWQCMKQSKAGQIYFGLFRAS